MSSTIVARDGSLTRENWKPDPHAPIDCFYVYPTISDDPHGNSSLVPGAGEKRAVEMQFARFASICRPYAPMYRQVTLAALRSQIRGTPMQYDPELGYRDVLAAWKHYLKYDNRGRGVVLVGHSQGSRVLIELIKNEIDGTRQQRLLISALLLGMNVEVPKGGEVGGSFKHVPLCTSAAQTGCVISFMSFRAGLPPTTDSRFGRVATAGMESACSDPMALSGTKIHAYLPTRVNLLGQTGIQEAWSTMAGKVDTPFVSLPELIEARCTHDEHGSYLAVSMDARSDDRRPSDIPGDIFVNGKILQSWGLHLDDVNLAMGNLFDIVRHQTINYLSNRTKHHK